MAISSIENSRRRFRREEKRSLRSLGAAFDDGIGICVAQDMQLVQGRELAGFLLEKLVPDDPCHSGRIKETACVRSGALPEASAHAAGVHEDYKQQDKYLPHEYFERVCDRREIQKFVITNETTLSRKPKQLERYVKAIPTSFDLFVYDVTQIIYANKVAYINFTNETAWIMEDERLATFQQQLFKLLLKKLN